MKKENFQLRERKIFQLGSEKFRNGRTRTRQKQTPETARVSSRSKKGTSRRKQ